jgi:signal transduction histidine kinase
MPAVPAAGPTGIAAGVMQELLRDANEQLVLSALGAHASQVAAETAHRLQREHFAVVAHELRGPLSPIRMAAGMLGRISNDELPRMAGIIDREVVHMSRLIGDLLDLSRVHTGKLRLERSQIRLGTVIQAAIDASREAMAARGQELTLALEPGELDLYGDAVRLTQVVRNLLDNASKYTPEGGRITLETTRVGATVAISISDNGIGITPEALKHVFEPFAQDAHAVGFNAAGLGIGLAVVRELVEAHGGTVLACSDGPGLGSCFVVTLTLSTGRAGARGLADLGTD